MRVNSSVSPQILQRRIEAAQGKIPANLILRNGRYLDVFHGVWRTGDIAIIDGTIVGLEPGLKGTREIDLRGKAVTPGFIDAHVHLESSLMVPSSFERVVLPRGTTTVVADPHELANVMGVAGIQYFLDAADQLQLDLRVMLSSCVPATTMETNGGGIIGVEDLLPLASHSQVLGLAEMMNFPGVLYADPEVLAKLAAFQTRGHSHQIDGHCPMVRGQSLSAYAAAGISSCHESSEFAEAAEKITKGMKVWIREGSVAKDLHALIPLLNAATAPSIGFCTDDRNPLDIFTEGHVDHLLREAIRLGTPMEVVYRSASLSVARHYGLRGIGAIAPGYRADLVILNDERTVSIDSVLQSGVFSHELPTEAVGVRSFAPTVRAVVPEAVDLQGPAGSVHVIEVWPGKILTGRRVSAHDARGVARISVLERYGRGSKPANAYVTGFGENFHGAIASSVGHDSHNLIVVGSNVEDMRAALAALIRTGGGFAVVQSGSVLAELALPFGGLMTAESPTSIAASLQKLRDASRSVGCELAEPFLQLAFLSLPVIPSLKLTDRGLVDVDQFALISVRAG